MKIIKRQLLERYRVHKNTLDKYIKQVGIADYKNASQEEYNKLIALLDENERGNNINTSLNIGSEYGIEFEHCRESTHQRLEVLRDLYNYYLNAIETDKESIQQAYNNNLRTYDIQARKNILVSDTKELREIGKEIERLENTLKDKNVFLNDKGLFLTNNIKYNDLDEFMRPIIKMLELNTMPYGANYKEEWNKTLEINKQITQAEIEENKKRVDRGELLIDEY